MEIRLQGVCEFWFTLEPAQLDILRDMSRLHYDAVCRQASYDTENDDPINGFLTIWSQNYEYSEEVFKFHATNNQIQTCLKIMEISNWFYHADKQDKRDLVLEMDKSFYAALKMANEMYGKWSVTVGSKPEPKSE